MLDVKALLSKILSAIKVDYIVEQGTDNGWTYRKWDSGKLDAERARNIGQVTIGTVEVSPIRVGGTVTSALPSMAISGSLDINYIGNSSGSPSWIEHISPNSWRIAKATTSNITLQNVTVLERVIDGRWK